MCCWLGVNLKYLIPYEGCSTLCHSKHCVLHKDMTFFLHLEATSRQSFFHHNYETFFILSTSSAMLIGKSKLNKESLHLIF